MMVATLLQNCTMASGDGGCHEMQHCSELSTSLKKLGLEPEIIVVTSGSLTYSKATEKTTC